jgi:hypothetical protein
MENQWTFAVKERIRATKKEKDLEHGTQALKTKSHLRRRTPQKYP